MNLKNLGPFVIPNPEQVLDQIKQSHHTKNRKLEVAPALPLTMNTNTPSLTDIAFRELHTATSSRSKAKHQYQWLKYSWHSRTKESLVRLFSNSASRRAIGDPNIRTIVARYRQNDTFMKVTRMSTLRSKCSSSILSNETQLTRRQKPLSAAQLSTSYRIKQSDSDFPIIPITLRVAALEKQNGNFTDIEYLGVVSRFTTFSESHFRSFRLLEISFNLLYTLLH